MKISINKISKKLRDAIIKEVPTAESINYKGETVKQPNNKDIVNILQKILVRLDKIEADIKAIKNCPTIKKELQL